MRKVRQSFDELRVGDIIRLKGWTHNCRITAKYTFPLFSISKEELNERVEYSSYDYTPMEDWIGNDKIRYIAMRMPIDKLRQDMGIVLYGWEKSMPLDWVRGDQMCLDNLPRESKFMASYEKDYNFSLLEPHEAAELVDDPLERLAFQILAKDPMALDAARDILKC